MNESGYKKVSDARNNLVTWTQRPLIRQVAVSSCIWVSYFHIGLLSGLCPVLVAQLRREPLSDGYIVNDEAASWISSTVSFSSIPCVLLLGLMGEYLGRRLSYIFICLISGTSFVVLYCATSFKMLILALILQGPLVGGSSNVCLMIASECVSPKYRGLFLTIKSATVYWAIWVANAVGTFFHWKYIGILGMISAVYNILLIFFWPESPYWLATKGKIRKCREAHRWLKGTDESSEKELECLIQSEMERLRKMEGNNNICQRMIFNTKKILSTEFYRPTCLCILLTIMYSFSGKLVLTVYSLDIIKKITDNESVAYTGMLILDGITVLGMYIGCVVSRYTKRRTLFFSTEFVAIFFLFTLSLYIYLIKLGVIEDNVYLLISLLIAFSLSISCGPMILITSLISELLPLELRTFAAILQCIAGCITGAIFLKLAPYIFSLLESHGAFLFFAIASLISAMILLKYMPETSNKTLEEIEGMFKKKDKLKETKEQVRLNEPACPESSVNPLY